MFARPSLSGPSLLSPLANRVYRRLFGAQVVALVGTGLTTVALALLAYELSGADAGEVLGIALALKMLAYVFVSPLVASIADRLPRRGLLVALDVSRAAVVAAMPLVDSVWQVYVLIFLLSSFSAGFTPTFQATIPDILPEEASYTRALSLSRLAYDLEQLLSPALAAAALALVSFEVLFLANSLAFGCSALLVLSVAIPRAGQVRRAGNTFAKITYGTRRYLATPRLRGLLALNLAAAAASAVVIVNTVVYVRERFGLGDSDVALALGAAGAGSMLTALALPAVLDRIAERPVMLGGGALLAAGLGTTALVPGYAALITTWFALGIGLSLVQTPAGRLLQRSAAPPDRPALYAAQFSLSHACWLLTYPIAGLLAVAIGLDGAAAVLAMLAAAAVIGAALLWPPSPGARIERRAGGSGAVRLRRPVRSRRAPARADRRRGPVAGARRGTSPPRAASQRARRAASRPPGARRARQPPGRGGEGCGAGGRSPSPPSRSPQTAHRPSTATRRGSRGCAGGWASPAPASSRRPGRPASDREARRD